MDRRLTWLAAASTLLLSACSGGSSSTPAGAGKTESADEFVARVNQQLLELSEVTEAAGFVQATYITPDTELLNSRVNEPYLEFVSKAAEESRRYDGQQLSTDTARAIKLLKLEVSAPAPGDPAKRRELTQLTSRLEAMYGEAKFCPSGPDSCKTLDEL
jgi:peptidyl-dipeptidase A